MKEASLKSFLSEALASSVDRRQILEDFSASDHLYIAFKVVDAICRPALAAWNVARVNIWKFVEALE